MSDFFAGALQTSLTMEGLLFAAFGFLYSTYCQYSTLTTPEHPERAPVANKLARACLFVCLTVSLNALLAIYIIIDTLLSKGPAGIVLGVGFILTIVVIAFINWYLVLSML